MMSKEFLKKLGIFGITVGLTASPLAFGFGEQPDEPQEPAPHEEPAPDENWGGAGTDDPFAGTEAEGSDYETEYENEEEEWTFDEEEEEEQEWETPDEDDEASTW
ncbi:hypothetical protein [Halomonas mongoliensis]|uniref:hypothetical protein n=2 Tax=Halomonas mongoliensis TaxID=321265 RepID=UPI00403B35B6